MLYSLAPRGDAPRYLRKLNKSGSPYAGVLTSSAVTAVAVVLNFLFPGKVFLYLSIALIAGTFNWAMVVITQMKFRKRIGESPSPSAPTATDPVGESTTQVNGPQVQFAGR